MEKIFLVVPTNIELSPYVQLYCGFLDKENIKYEIIFWERKDATLSVPNSIVYKYPPKGFLGTLRGYYYFSRFCKNKIQHCDNCLIISFTLQMAFFMSDIFLSKKRHYVIDIRDYSKVIKFKWLFQLLFKKSMMNVISSRGFYNWLPTSNALICHNIPLNFFTDKFLPDIFTNHTVRILTIGQIRNYIANQYIISKLENHPQIDMIFSGDGIAKSELEAYVKAENITNVSFTGSYEKTMEQMIVANSDFMNIYLPDNLLSNFLMTNRFYLALLYKKPMIVSRNSEHAKYVSKYNLGIIVSDERDLYNDILDFKFQFNATIFNEACEMLISEIHKDMCLFENTLKKTIID